MGKFLLYTVIIIFSILLIGIIICLGIKISRQKMENYWSKYDLYTLDNEAMNKPQSDIIVAMTTSPDRLKHIDNTLKSWLKQTVVPKKIYIFIPYNYRNEILSKRYHVNQKYHSTNKIKIVWLSKDFGPATKFIGPYITFQKNQPYIFADDDVIYSDNLVENYQKFYNSNSNIVYCTRGWKCPKRYITHFAKVYNAHKISKPVQVDIVTGVGSIMLSNKLLGEDLLEKLSKLPKKAFFVDDIAISGILAKKGITKLVIPSLKKTHRDRLVAFQGSLILQNNINGKNNNIMLKYFKDSWLLSK